MTGILLFDTLYTMSLGSLTIYNYLQKKQGKGCAICGRAETYKNKTGRSKKLSIDHNHETGMVRGLLCAKCNFALGFVEENINTLQNMIKYLDFYKNSDSGIKYRVKKDVNLQENKYRDPIKEVKTYIKHIYTGETKICTKCKIEKPITDYHTDLNSPDKHRYYCKDCSKAVVYKKRGKVYKSCKRLQEPSIAAPEKSEGLGKALPLEEEYGLFLCPEEDYIDSLNMEIDPNL